MKQEIYVKEMPECCGVCPCLNIDLEDGMWCKLIDYGYVDFFDEKRKDCPLKLLHDHDKELVAKVCKRVFNIFDGNNIDYICVDDVIERLQKEFEDGNIDK